MTTIMKIPMQSTYPKMSTVRVNVKGLNMRFPMMKLRMKDWVRRSIEKLEVKCARICPRWLVMHCTIRLIVHATTKKWKTTVIPELEAMEAMRRWDESNEQGASI